MEISIATQNPDNVSIGLQGEFDAAAANDARQTFTRVVDQMSGDVVVDMSGVRFIDSSGVGAIVFLFKRLNAQGRDLTLAHAAGQPADLLKMLRVDKAVSWLEPA
jgi:anti-anti-sigma factor